MRLARWRLDQLITWSGTLLLTLLLLPMGLLLARNEAQTTEQRLLERGMGLAETLATQIVDPMLVEDDLALHGALHKAAAATVWVRYICVKDRQGRLLMDTFAGEPPPALTALWHSDDGPVLRFRTPEEPMLEVRSPILSGQLGTLHVGLSRAEAVAASRRVVLGVGVVLAGVFWAVFAGARLVAVYMTEPLRALESAVSRFPTQHDPEEVRLIAGTLEVQSLARGFAQMARRVESLETERSVTQQRMVHAERLATLGEVAAGLAHEVHNPLDGMLECVRYLEVDPAKSDLGAKYYPMLREGLGRIARVMRQMLTFAHSGQKVSREPCRLSDVLESLEPLVKTHLDGRRVRLEWKRPGASVCLCDRHGFAQAALNLILNAAEAVEGSPEAVVRIEASCDANWVYLAVEDSGPGVAAEIRERIFDPFFTTKSPGKGTGLGLPVSRRLIRAAGGDVELAPEPSPLGGALFVMRLPRVDGTRTTEDE